MTDTPGRTPEERETLESSRARRETIYRLRGEFVSNFSLIDFLVNSIILAYMVPDVDENADDKKRLAHSTVRDEFRAWFLDPLRFIQKVRIIRNIIASLGLEDRLGGFPRQLERLNRQRNDIAHTYVSFPVRTREEVFEGVKEGRQFDWLSVSLRGGISEEPIDIEALERAVEETSVVNFSPHRLTAVALAFHRGEDPREALGLYEMANPNLPPVPE